MNNLYLLSIISGQTKVHLLVWQFLCNNVLSYILIKNFALEKTVEIHENLIFSIFFNFNFPFWICLVFGSHLPEVSTKHQALHLLYTKLHTLNINSKTKKTDGFNSLQVNWLEITQIT